MKRIIILTLAGLLTACSTNKLAGSKVAGRGTEVTYHEGRNYFAIVDKSSKDVLRSQREFNKVFSPAAFMGKDGEPTEIDFSKEMVIPFIMPETNHATEISIQSVQKVKSTLHINVLVKIGKAQSYTIRPATFIVVDKASYKHIDLRASYTNIQ